MKTFFETYPELERFDEKAISKWINFQGWINKRIKASRLHFMTNLDLDHWPTDKFLDHKGELYYPTHLDWPEGRDFGVLYVKPVGSVRRLQAGVSTDITVVNDNEIRIQVSRERERKKKTKSKLGKLDFPKGWRKSIGSSIKR